VKIDLDAKTTWVLILKAAIGFVELDGLLEVLRIFSLQATPFIVIVERAIVAS
jgi:hypothetical protein